MSDASLRRSEPMTVEGFLAFLDQRSGDEKWELIDGVPLMITGGTLHHARIGGNIDRLLGPAAERRGCMSLRGFLVEANEISSFEPDVMVRCGNLDGRSRRAQDPVIVFEVLSPSTCGPIASSSSSATGRSHPPADRLRLPGQHPDRVLAAPARRLA